MRIATRDLRKALSFLVTVLVLFASIIALAPETAEAPPAGTLNITWKNLAPITNTFQGDVNLSMLWLSMEAQGADITLDNMTVEVYGFPPEGINRTFAWDDRNYDENMSYGECIIAENTTSPYLLPPNGTMVECVQSELGQRVSIDQSTSRYFTIYLDLDFDPTQNLTDRELRVCVNHLNSSASTVLGLPACSSTIEINRRFFYDDMDHGQGNWTFTGGDDGGLYPNGLWHMSQGEEDCINNMADMPFYHSNYTSWWYGRRFDWFGDYNCMYYTNRSGSPFISTRNWGELRSGWIDARKGTSLAMTLYQFLAREPDDGVDLAQIFLEDSTGWHFISSELGTDDHWKKLILNLSQYAGEQVRLEFRFDTMDERGNMFFGWFLDDLAVYGEILEHDITVTQLSVPDFIFLEPQNVSAQVSNIGNRTEYNIEVNLTQNGTTISKKTIPLLASEDNMSVTFSWTPPGGGLYEICIETTPVMREDVLWNNYDCKMVNVTKQVYTKVAILRSYGTQEMGPKATWDYLNAHWEDYGPDPILIDYTSLNIYPITYQAINDTQADVLVLSGSGYYYREPIGTELTDEEMGAIEKWTNEGHGFVTIGSAFNMKVPNNNGLVGLAGIKDQPYGLLEAAPDVNIFPECANHSIFRNVSSSFENAFGPSMLPGGDLSWNDSDLDGGMNCAWSRVSINNKWTNPTAIVINKGNVLISIAADVMPNEDEKQLLYNSFVWSRMEVNDYDVEVTTIAPKYGEPTFPVNIRSRVTNVGKKDLSLVRVDLKVDGIVVDTRNITDLPHFESVEAYFTWTPPSMGVYEICSFVEIIGHVDQDPSNNEDCSQLNITVDIPIQVYVLDSWGTDFANEAPWDYLNGNWSLHGSVRVEVNYMRFNKERITYQDLVDSFADVLLISSSRSGNMANPVGWGYRFGFKELQAIERYTQEGHGLIGTGLTFDTEHLPEHGQVLGPLFGLKAMNLYCHKHEIADLSVLRPWENHPLFNNIPDNYAMSNGTTLSPCLVITDWPTPGIDWYYPLNWTSDRLDGGLYEAMSYPTNNATVISHDLGGYKATYITNFVEKNSSWIDSQLLYNAMVWVGYQPGIHDIGVSNITVPRLVKPSPPVDVTATLTNLGTVVENNFARGIDVFLTENGLVVDQTNVPSLEINESKNVTLTWDPPDLPLPGTYEICMKAWPVMWERNTSNNEACTNVEVIDPNIVIVSILDSWGTDNPMLAPWDEIVTNWLTYGPQRILIDYTTLDKENITERDLINSGAEVLLISSSNSTMLTTSEFSLEEIDAIQRYIDGSTRGIVGTGLTLSSTYMANNNELAPMFGIDPSASFTSATGVGVYQQLQPAHTMFYNVSDPFFTGSGISCTPGLLVPDPNGWVPNLLLPSGRYLANSTPEPSFGAVIANDTGSHRGVYLTSFMEMSSSDDDRQVLYNAMVWSAGRRLYPALSPPSPENLSISKVTDRLRLNWTVIDPRPDVWFNIYRANSVNTFDFGTFYDQVTFPPYLDVSGTATDPENYYYVVRAVNITSGKSELNTAKVGKLYNVLHKRTNDISIPFELENTSVEAVFGDISADIREVSVYDSTTATWLSWRPGIGGTLTDIDNTMGIRLVSKRKDLGFISIGRVPQSTDIDLTIIADNWFFVGYPCFMTNILPDILDNHGLAGLYILVLHYDPTDRKAPWKWFDPNDPGGSPLQSLETGKGYWILMIADGNWRVPGE